MIQKIDRVARSVFTLNRDREYQAVFQTLKVGTKPEGTLLDVGSGDGFWTARLSMHVACVVGLEPDKGLMSLAKAHHSSEKVKYVRGVAEALPFPDQCFDRVASISCVEHFREPVRGLEEMVRVLRPGGRLAISADSLLPGNSSVAFRAWHKQRHFVTRYFASSEVVEILTRAGLECEERETRHLLRSPLAGRLREIFVRRPVLWLPVFPAFYFLVRWSDHFSVGRLGQIIVVSGSKKHKGGSGLTRNGGALLATAKQNEKN